MPGGSYPEIAEEAARRWKEGYAPYVLPSGRYSKLLGSFSGVASKNHIYIIKNMKQNGNSLKMY